MKKIRRYIALSMLPLFTLFSSCSDLDEINRDPDKPTKVPSSMLCTGVLLDIAKFQGDKKAYIATNALPKYVVYANEGPMAEQYNSLGKASFERYLTFPNIDDMVKYAQGELFENGYTGIAHFSKAYILYRTTMEMGDVPNTDANRAGEGVFRPKYDTQESVFIAILDHLKIADEKFAAAGTAKLEGDLIYNGDYAKWRKVTNAFALKVLMSLSKRTDVSTLNVKGRFSDILSANNLMTANTDNFSLVYADETGKYHPLYEGVQFTKNTLLSTLVVSNLKKLNDYRLFYYGEPSAVQLLAGKLEDDADAYVGVAPEIEYATINTIYNSRDYSQINNRYHVLKNSESRALMSYAEQNLIIAEAIELGWVAGNSQDYYENGVKAALAQVGATNAAYAHGRPITQTYIDGYFTGDAAYKATKAERLEQIWMQRYLLNFMQDAISSYFEYRRTGYPVFPINPNTNLNSENVNAIPKRWLYPEVETTNNINNLQEALDRQYEGYDEINKVMWLLRL